MADFLTIVSYPIEASYPAVGMSLAVLLYHAVASYFGW